MAGGRGGSQGCTGWLSPGAAPGSPFLLPAFSPAAPQQVRALFPEVAAAVEGLQPGATMAADAALAGSTWLVGWRAEASAAADKQAESLLAAAAAAPMDVADGSCGGSGKNGSPSGGSEHSAAGAKQGAVPPQVVRPSAQLEAAPASAVRRALEQAGVGAPQLRAVLHMAVLAAVGGVLVVCRPAFEGLDKRSVWVLITSAPLLSLLRSGLWGEPAAGAPAQAAAAAATPEKCTARPPTLPRSLGGV